MTAELLVDRGVLPRRPQPLGAPLSTQSVIHHTRTVAGGPFAPGHLGELTQQIPFELVDAALANTGTLQCRIRSLPARVVVYLLLAAGLFTDQGYSQVWQRLTAGLEGLPVAHPTAAALTQARRRLGTAPLHALFDLLRGPGATPRTTSGVRWGGLLVCAIDGTTMTVPDTPANLRCYPKQHGSSYPLLRVVALVACGTRSIIDCVFGPASSGETTYTDRLAASGSLKPGMLLLVDRNLATAKLLAAVTATGAQLLGRGKTDRKLPLLTRYRDGSYLSVLGGRMVRVITAQITIATRTGRRTGDYRLVTTLTDPQRYPATSLVKLYHQRWEVETAYLELKASILGGRVLRARIPQGIPQEVYALLCCYQALRGAITDATSTRADLDPDRASFTIALNTARDQLIQAAGIIATSTVDLVGRIGRAVLANLLPARRLRVNPRTVKRAISKYNARGPDISHTSYKATVCIHVLTPPALTNGPGP